MKNINVKKVVAGAAALALGVGVLGVAIAGNNSGDTFGPVVKGDVYTTSTMQPKVSIVTGVNGDDDQWAQNIANAIATSAKKRNPQYDAWVPTPSTPGTTTGDGKEFRKNFLGAEAGILKLDYKDYPELGDYKVKVNNAQFGTTEIKVKDFLIVDGVYPAFDPDPDVKDLTTAVSAGTMQYQIQFTPGIIDEADDTSSPDFKFKIMGKDYTLESWDGDEKELVLVQNKASTAYSEGDSFSIDNHTVEIVHILDSGANNEFEAELALKNSSGTVISTEIYGADEEIFTDYLEVSATVAKVYSTRVNIVAGTSVKLTLVDGEVIEDFPTKDDELWVADMDVVDGTLNSITITNDDPDVEWKNEDALRIGEAASYPFDFAKVKFVGLTEEDSKVVSVEDGYINYTDDDDEDHEVFFFDRTTGTNGISRYTTRKTIDGKKLYFDFNTTDKTFTVQLDNKDGDYLQDNGSWGNTVHKFVTADGDVTPIEIATYNNDDEIIKYGVYTDSDETIKELVIGLQTESTGIINDTAGHSWKIGTMYTEVDNDVTKSDGLIGETATGYADAALKSMFEFIVVDGDGEFTAHIDAYTGNLVNTGSSKYKAGVMQVESEEFFDLDQEDTDDLRWAYTTFGTKYEVDGGLFTATIPEEVLYAKIFVGGGTTTTGGTEENPYDEYIMTPVTVSDLLKKDSMAATGTLIVVGGHLVNKFAEGITEDSLVEEDDFIVGKHANSNIYVAGWTKADTGRAASELVNVITSWPIE